MNDPNHSLEDERLTGLMLNYSAEMYKYRNILNPTTKWEDLTAHQRSVVNSYRDELKKLLAQSRQDSDKLDRAELLRILFDWDQHRQSYWDDYQNKALTDDEWTEVRDSLNRWKSDIETCFTPKCSYCGRKTAKVVGQTTKGKYAQENNHLPRNWGYYCQRCHDEGMKMEREAMYGR